MPNSKQYEDSGAAVYRFPIQGGGHYYVVVVKGDVGRVTILLVNNDGTVVDTSGEAVISSDLAIARTYLHLAGGSHLNANLRPGMYDSTIAQQVRRQVGY